MLTRRSQAGNTLRLNNGTNGHKNLPEKCRICLDEGEIPIFGANDISADVTEFGNIKIGKDDNLPQYLCEPCSTLLQAAILFRKTAKQSDEVLRRTDYSDSGTEDPDCKEDDEIYIKTEYLESDCTSDSELDEFDRLKHSHDSGDEATNYYPIISEAEVLRRTDYSDSGTEDPDCKEDDEIYIKTEYLESDCTSDSELDDFDRLKHSHDSGDEATNYYPTISEADTQDSDDNKGFQTNLLHVKREEGGSINEADSETFMIIVSDKNKQNLKLNEDGNSYLDMDNDGKTTDQHGQTFMKILPHQRECEVCHTIVLKSAYRVHLKEHRKKYKEKFDKKYGKIECEYCGKQVSKSYLKVHMKIHGTFEEQAERLIKCPICSNMCNTRYYSQHVKRMHPTKSEKKQAILKKLRKESSPTSSYNKCPVCDRKIKESDFKSHLEKHNGPLPRYVCEKCGKVFKYPSAFKTHCLTHGSELKYKCQFCPYRGLHQALLKIHVRTHTGDYNYKCTECPARFITKSNLTKHLNRHKGLCTFKCEQCNKGFYAKRDLEKHNRNVHMFTKHHVCEYCGKAFGHRDNMLSHQLKVHKREKIIPRGRMPSYLKAQLMQLE